MLSKQLEKLLKNVQKPARYTGGEFNSVVKDKDKVEFRYAFCFPDNYEIGMSHLGMKILYSLINAREEAWCEKSLCVKTIFRFTDLKAATVSKTSI